jgi:hypothetical protein
MWLPLLFVLGISNNLIRITLAPRPTVAPFSQYFTFQAVFGMGRLDQPHIHTSPRPSYTGAYLDFRFALALGHPP